MGYLNYRELISQLGIPPGSLLVVTADLTRLAMTALRKESEFNAGLFIDSIQQHLGTEGTLIIPAFNFNLKDRDYFNPAKSLPITGALAVEALKRSDFQRTRNALHSFLVWGRHSTALCAMDNASSFGKDSPFAFMKENHAVMLLIDTTVSAAFTFVHHVEEMEKVRYRKYKKIRIRVDENDGITVMKEYLLYAKKPGWTMALEGLENIMIHKQVARRSGLCQVPCTLVDIHEAYPLIKEDILHNRARNLARFSPDLYLREKAKSILALAGFHTLSDKISHDPGLL